MSEENKPRSKKCSPSSAKKAGRQKNILTPYQGKKRSYGHFKCTQCNARWGSAYSWANTWQQCKTCKTKVYPYSQVKLK